ncbi:hypothetical protein A7J05_01305 [Streptomyces alfalfae]|uniref:HEAT repeat domain-containing protein n=1 Tax=Streptomyces alfalfae TaxID=1642299 RepID=A0ABM6GLV3_9ACTN|nr:hypothetical protein [Streptomyces alfalfae]APY84585.1 hypothetical protein A7J05_01305 [Streptomyces alfalfae]
MNHHNAPQEEPAEHLRFAAYLSELEQVSDADEADLVSEVLTDPDQTMARSAVLWHLDRRATDIHPGPAYEPWAEWMTHVTVRHPFLARRLQEWSLFRAITLGQPWSRDALLESSDWLQLKTAAGPNTEAVEVLAEHGRTKRIRNTARINLKQSSPPSAASQHIHKS